MYSVLSDVVDYFFDVSDCESDVFADEERQVCEFLPDFMPTIHE